MEAGRRVRRLLCYSRWEMMGAGVWAVRRGRSWTDVLGRANMLDVGCERSQDEAKVLGPDNREDGAAVS